MAVRWTGRAQVDLMRLHSFLDAVNPPAAADAVALLLAAVRRLAAHPRVGLRLGEFSPREVRRLIVGDYELRYELKGRDLYVLRIWHVHEDR